MFSTMNSQLYYYVKWRSLTLKTFCYLQRKEINIVNNSISRDENYKYLLRNERKKKGDIHSTVFSYD